jgi:hypothetical protein
MYPTMLLITPLQASIKTLLLMPSLIKVLRGIQTVRKILTVTTKLAISKIFRMDSLLVLVANEELLNRKLRKFLKNGMIALPLFRKFQSIELTKMSTHKDTWGS